MCMKRENNDESERYPFPIFDFIDLTMDEIGEDDTNITPQNDQWNYPYNLLPSSDEDDPVTGFIDSVEDNNGDFNFTESNTTQDSLTDSNQNTNASSTSVNMTFIFPQTNDTDLSAEWREFELNVPQILLSMSRISNNLFGQASTSRN